MDGGGSPARSLTVAGGKACRGRSLPAGHFILRGVAGQPGDFTVTLKKPGEKIEFDVPYPLPEEMTVDESGKELEATELHKRYMEYNEGKVDILTLDEALDRLETAAPRAAEVGHLRYFAGFTAEETAAAMGLSLSPVVREWRFVRTHVRSQLEETDRRTPAKGPEGP